MTSVLVINDALKDRDWIGALAKLFDGAQVHAYETGAQGIAHFKEHGADCIFLDDRLASEDSLSVLAFLTATSAFAKVVLLCDERDEALATTALKAGAMGYVAKSEITEEMVLRLIGEAIAEAEQDRASLKTGTNRYHLLLVHDTEDNRASILEFIEQGLDGATVKSVATGIEAMDAFGAGQWDCVILDHRLDVEDGLDTLARLKDISPFTPVIMLTGQDNEEIAAKSIKFGATDYLIKQRLNTTILRSVIETAISRCAFEAKVAEQEAQHRQFLRSLVHDLRAPMRNLRLIGEMAIEEAEEGQIDEMMSLLASQGLMAGQATDLIGTLDNYSLLNDRVVLKPVDLNTAAEAATANLATEIAERKAEVTIADLPRAHGHLPWLTQLFQNLISNGLKYNQQDVPRVVVETNMGEHSDGSLIVVVKDNGIGIPVKYLQLIFEPLKRLWGREIYEGSGLGLASCKKIVEQHSGQIWCMSKEGEGSAFYVSFPHPTIGR